MCQMVHKLCGAVIAQSADPDFNMSEGCLLQSKDWRTPEGKEFRRGTPIICPKCKKQVSIHHLEFTNDQ